MDSANSSTGPLSDPSGEKRNAISQERATLRPSLPERALPGAGRLMLAGLAAGILAGVSSWLIGEIAIRVFRPPLVRQEVMGQVIYRATFEDQSSADTKNAALAFAALGGSLGLALGIAGGLAGNCRAAAARAGAVGALLGSTLAAAATLAILPAYYREVDRAVEEMSQNMTVPLLVHGGIWAACGLSGGVAFGLGTGGGWRRVINAALGGLIGAVLGAALYEMIGAMAFPASRTANPISWTWHSRLFARLLVASLVGLVASAVFNMQTQLPRPAQSDG
jgi:hypothetical protein